MCAELPWERAHAADARYAAWCGWSEADPPGPPPAGPWRRVDAAALRLLRAALQTSPARRADLDALQRHDWLADDEPAAARSITTGTHYALRTTHLLVYTFIYIIMMSIDYNRCHRFKT